MSLEAGLPWEVAGSGQSLAWVAGVSPGPGANSVGMARVDTDDSVQADHPKFTKVLWSWPKDFEEPHPWWPDGKGLLGGCPGLLPGPSLLLCCRGWGWWLGLMALYLPTSDCLVLTGVGVGVRRQRIGH